jgi:hypothetical protein
MKRLLFHVLSLISLLLFVTTAALWRMTYDSKSEPLLEIQTSTNWYRCVVGSSRGLVECEFEFWQWFPRPTHESPQLGWLEIPPQGLYGNPPQPHRLGISLFFADHHWSEKSGTAISSLGIGVVLPDAYPAILFAILPALAFWKRIWRNQRQHCGHCRVCGYDLRASPNRCPECGTVTATPEQT